jgi:hypothetical protein
VASAEQGDPADAADRVVRYHGDRETVGRTAVLLWSAVLAGIRESEWNWQEDRQQFFTYPELGRFQSWKPFNGCG